MEHDEDLSLTQAQLTALHDKLKYFRSQLAAKDKRIGELEELQNAEAALRESEARFRAAFEQGAFGMALSKPSGRILKVNPAFCAMLGYSEAELETRTFYDITYPDDQDINRAGIQQIIDGEASSFGMEKRYIRKDGTLLWADMHTVAVYDAARYPCYFVTHAVDITERKQAEEALRESEGKFRSLFENSIDGVLLTEPDGRILAANPAACRMLGRTETEICQVGRSAIVDQQDPSFPGAIEERSRTGKVRCELTFVHKDGTRFPVELSSALFTSSNGRLCSSMFLRDISTRKQTEEALSREQAFLEAAIDLLPLPLTFINLQRQVILANRAAQGRLSKMGLSSREESQLLHPETKTLIPMHDWPSARALQGEVVIAQEYLLTNPNTGEEIPCLIYAAPVIVNGQIIASGVLLENITALKEADRAKDEFLAVVSHELQTPLTSMLGWSSEALLTGQPELMAQALEVIHRNAVRQKRLIADILDMSRLIHRKIALQSESTDLWTQANYSVENASPLATAQNLQVILAPPSVPLPVCVDPVRLQQCIGNLLHNSLKFTPEGGTITVCCRRQSEQAILCVTDTGCGIDPAALPTLFKAFRQVERNERHGGLGLGLAVTRGIVELHGGTISAASPGRGQGCTFTITLPISETSRPNA